MSDEETRAVAEAYAEAKRRQREGKATWIDEDTIQAMEDYMNGPHPLLDLLATKREGQNDDRV